MSQHRSSQRHALAAAAVFMTMATTIPALAADTVVSNHEQAQQPGNRERHQTYAYDKEIFTCGETTEKEGKSRSLVGEPYEPRLPMWNLRKMTLFGRLGISSLRSYARILISSATSTLLRTTNAPSARQAVAYSPRHGGDGEAFAIAS